MQFQTDEPRDLADLCRDACETRTVQNAHGLERPVTLFLMLRRQKKDISFEGDLTQEYVLWEGASRHCKALYLLAEDLPPPEPWPQPKSSAHRRWERMRRVVEATRRICGAYSDWETTTQWIVPAWRRPQYLETNGCIPLLVSQLYKERLRDFPTHANCFWLPDWLSEAAVRRIWTTACEAYRNMGGSMGPMWPRSTFPLSSAIQGTGSWRGDAVQLDVETLFPSTIVDVPDPRTASNEDYDKVRRARSDALDVWRRIMDSERVTAPPERAPRQKTGAAALPRDPDHFWILVRVPPSCIRRITRIPPDLIE